MKKRHRCSDCYRPIRLRQNETKAQAQELHKFNGECLAVPKEKQRAERRKSPVTVLDDFGVDMY